MASTTNYSWSTPDDTALVKDGASAIRTLGSSVDTTVKALNPETTLGDLAYRSSTANVKTRLGLGTAGQVLAVNSGANAPEWVTPAAGGGMTLISGQTLSGVSGVTYSSLGSYKQLLLVWTGIYHSTTGSNFDIRFNNNSSSIYAFAQGGNSIFSNTDTIAGGGSLFGSTSDSTTAGQTCKGYLILDNYTSATNFKAYNSVSFYRDTGAATQYFRVTSGQFGSTTAITSLDIVRTSGSATLSNAANTEIRLYGVS